jgi:hypothetical protein
MAKMRVSSAFLFILLLATCEGSAQDSSPIRITPQTVFDRYIEAIGGKQAVQQVHTARTKAEVYFDTYAPPVVWIDHFQDDTGRFYEDASDKISQWRAGFDGTTFWQVYLRSGSHLRFPKRPFHTPAQIGIVVNPFGNGKEAKVIGASVVSQSKAIVVQVPEEKGDSKLYYFDGNTGLLVRTDTPMRFTKIGYDGSELKGKAAESWASIATCTYAHYQYEPQTHVLFAREVRCTMDDIETTLRVTKIFPNIAIDPNKFVAP